MSELFIVVLVAVWIFGAVNSIRKAIARSQAQAQAVGQQPVQAPQYQGGVRPTPAQRVQALQSAVRVIRAVSTQTAAAQTAAQSPGSYVAPAARYVAPAADTPMSMLTNMVAPSMPAFDTITLDGGASSALAYDSVNPPPLNVAQIMGLTNGQNFATLSIVAAAVIGPPVGLRPGASLAADW